MLVHFTIGPDTGGDYSVAYYTPGCDVPTVVGISRSKAVADEHVIRLNAEQSERETAIKLEHELCGIFGANCR